MTTQTLLLLLISVAYLLGSIPFGLIVARTRGIDPRTAGSKNIGATNVGRLLGGKFFAIVFILDVLKGLVPMVAAGIIARRAERDMMLYILWLLVGFAAIAGHMFSIFLRFTGGKGVATSTGVILGLFPYYTIPGFVAIAIWLLIFLPLRYVSLASIIGSLAFPIAYAVIGIVRGWDVLGAQLPLLIFACLMALMIVYKHRSNIARLRSGTEHRFARQA